MNKTILKYGDSAIETEYNPQAFQVCIPNIPDMVLSPPDIIAALREPIESPPVMELARGKKSALIVVSDATRIARADLILPLLLEELSIAGIAREAVRVVIALGTHRPATDEEMRMLLGEASLSLEVVQHDCHDRESLFYTGKTSRGTEVWMNRLVSDSDLVITVSAVNAHYFAGFGGGRKSIIPGLAGRETIVGNHLLAVDFEKGVLAEGVEPCRLDGNPVHEDMIEGVALSPPDFAVQTILTPGHEIGGVWAGHWISSHRQACGEFLRRHGVQLPARRRVVIVSPGGMPKDIDLIQSHKTVQYATRALEPGGTLVLLARCPDGIGNPRFHEYFPLDDMKAMLAQLREGGPFNGHTALALHSKAERFRIILISELKPAMVRRFGFEPADSLEDALGMLGREVMQENSGYIFPEGALTLPMID